MNKRQAKKLAKKELRNIYTATLCSSILRDITGPSLLRAVFDMDEKSRKEYEEHQQQFDRKEELLNRRTESLIAKSNRKKHAR